VRVNPPAVGYRGRPGSRWPSPAPRDRLTGQDFREGTQSWVLGAEIPQGLSDLGGDRLVVVCQRLHERLDDGVGQGENPGQAWLSEVSIG
jgi:hypothetical protein